MKSQLKQLVMSTVLIAMAIAAMPSHAEVKLFDSRVVGLILRESSEILIHVEADRNTSGCQVPHYLRLRSSLATYQFIYSTVLAYQMAGKRLYFYTDQTCPGGIGVLIGIDANN